MKGVIQLDTGPATQEQDAIEWGHQELYRLVKECKIVRLFNQGGVLRSCGRWLSGNMIQVDW